MSPVVCVNCNIRFSPSPQLYVDMGGSFSTVSFSDSDFVRMVQHWKAGHHLKFDHPKDMIPVADFLMRESFRQDLARFKKHNKIHFVRDGKNGKEKAS